MKKHFVEPRMVFGKRTVLASAGRNKYGEAAWLVRCACGRDSVISTGNLVKTSSCGVGGCKKVVRRVERQVKSMPEYHAWHALVMRCRVQTNSNYESYGGRGISVCQRWRESFACFYADMGERPSADHSIDRINNDGGYEPGNCRWATRKQQCRNRRSTTYLDYQGEHLSVAEWAERFGMKYVTLRTRLRNGWPIADALTTPVATRQKTPTAF